MDYSLKETAALLGIAPSTLRKWSEQFDALLSDSTRQASVIGGSTTQRRYTESDIAILHQAKALLRSGRTYDQVFGELAGNHLGKRSDDQIDLRPQSRAPADYATRPLPLVQVADEQAILKDDAGAAALEHALQAQQSRIDQLHEYLLRLQTENETLYERRMPWRERLPWLFSYRTVLIVAICCSAVLMALGIVWWATPRVFDDVNGMPGAATVAPHPATVITMSGQTTLSPRPLTPRALPAQAANTTADQPATPEASVRPTLTLTTQKSTPATAQPLPTTGPAAAAIILQVAEAEAALRKGQIEATITYGSGQRSSAQVRFDLGDDQRVPRFQITTTYAGATGAQTIERITIGDQSWERQQDGQWTVMPARESALKQLQVFFPRTDSISDPKQVTVEGADVLRWYDAARDADTTLRVDAAGIPRQLRRVSRANGLVLTVTYSGWNTSVEITPPDTN